MQRLFRAPRLTYSTTANKLPARDWNSIKSMMEPLPVQASTHGIENAITRKITERVVLLKPVPSYILPKDIKRLGGGITEVWMDRSNKTFASKNQMVALFSSPWQVEKFVNKSPYWLDGHSVVPYPKRHWERPRDCVTAVEGSVNVLISGLPFVRAGELYAALNGFGILKDPMLAVHQLPMARWMVRCIDESCAWRLIRALNYTEWGKDRQLLYVLRLRMMN